MGRGKEPARKLRLLDAELYQRRKAAGQARSFGQRDHREGCGRDDCVAGHPRGSSTAEIETQKKELENVCNPIMMKLYGQSGSGTPTDEPSADGGAGPTIDEVD